MHNLQRPRRDGRGTFDVVDRTARRLSESPTELLLRACFSSDGAARMVEAAEFFCERYDPSALNFESLRPGGTAATHGLAEPEPLEFAIGFQAAQAAAESAGVPIIYGPARVDSIVWSGCPVGKDALIVEPNGDISACYLPRRDRDASGLDLAVGRISDRVEISVDRLKALRRLSDGYQRCRSCFMRWHCAGGCHVQNASQHRRRERDGFCQQTRIIGAAQLLRELGATDLTHNLFRDTAALTTLATHPSDHLCDWKRP